MKTVYLVFDKYHVPLKAFKSYVSAMEFVATIDGGYKLIIELAE